jgi:hypothetical protein
MSGRQIELTWRCSSCGQRNLGRHLTCQACGNPKDDGEVYEMPPDPSRVASVTDPAMLRQATAGANWRCMYCGSDARAFDGSCAQCGATQAEGHGVARRVAHVPVVAARVVKRQTFPVVYLIPVVVIALIGCGVSSLLLRSSNRRYEPVALVETKPSFRDVEARVSAAHWKRQIAVDRWSIVEKEGFLEQRPADAMNVRSLGERVHHMEQVQRGMKTESYMETVTEMENETYSEQERCGEDCTTLPQSCHEECTNNQNGYASCHTVCSGGGQSCHPRYCSVQKTRMVPKSKQVPRTRQVPNMVDEPRMATAFAWKQWDWAKNRTLEEKGDDFAPRWPDDATVALEQKLGKGERERATRLESYQVEAVATDGTKHNVYPKTEAEFKTWENARLTLRVHSTGFAEVQSGPTREAD